MNFSPVDELFALDARLTQLATHRETAAILDDIGCEALDVEWRMIDQERQNIHWHMSDVDSIAYEVARG